MGSNGTTLLCWQGLRQKTPNLKILFYVLDGGPNDKVVVIGCSNERLPFSGFSHKVEPITTVSKSY